MDAEQGKRELFTNTMEGGNDPGLALTQDGNTFGPAGAQVDRRERVDEGAAANSPLWETRSISR